MDGIIFLGVLLGLVYLFLPIALIIIYVVLRNRGFELQQQVETLRSRLSELQAELNRLREAPPAAGATPATAEPEPERESAPGPEIEEIAPPAASVDEIDSSITAGETTAAASEPQPVPAVASMPPATASVTSPPPPPREPNPVDRLENGLRSISQAITSYFTDGNLFVRIGLLVLFFGVAFLLKYAAENSAIPLEVRFMGAALGGLALLATGWQLRLGKPVYALLLQGGGIGVTYITIFAAFRLADLLPPGLTFTLLVCFSAVTVALAILQDSRALAVFALIGGFLAPFLASTGSGNYIGLFSYYAVLNAAVFGVAWFRAWRLLNLLGFAFTFGVYVLWVAFDYANEDLYPACGFLLLFFLMYSLIGVLYARRQPEQLVGLVDGTLVFGTPVIVSGLLMAILYDYEYGIAGTCAAMGLYYLLLARYCWRNVGAEFRLLAEALLAIGVVFGTLAIPYALDGHWSSAAWALEAAGILWVALRQERFYAQCFAILLQVGAGVLFFWRNIDDVGTTLFINPAFLGGVFIALGALVSARLLCLQDAANRLRLLHIPFFAWGLGWWLVSALVQIDEYFGFGEDVVPLLALFSATALALVCVDRIRGWDWRPASVSSALLLPVLVLVALYATDLYGHVFVTPDLAAWVAALALCYWTIGRLETVTWPPWVAVTLHTAYVVFVALLLSAELLWLLQEQVPQLGQGYVAVLALGPLLAMRATQLGRLPALARLGRPLELALLGSLSLVVVLWSLLVNLANSGDPAPLPYLPLLNPVDLAHLAFFVLAAVSLQAWPDGPRVQREHLLILLGALVFAWLTALLMRSMHHYLDIRFDLSILLGDTRVQTAISILWTLIGMAGMLFASRRAIRSLWIVAAGLVGVVLFKMFFVDLGASGTVERIVSFLVVGSLLVATGYFSPIPSRQREETSHA